MTGNDYYDAPSLRPGYQGRGTIVYEPLSALSLTQRLGRLRFACYQLTSYLIAGLLVLLLMLLSRSLIPELAAMAGAAVIMLALTVYLVGLMVRRFHDMGKSGWWAVLGLVPVLNLAVMLYLYLGDGDSMVNRFGTPNPPPGILVILAGGLYWLFNVLSLIVTAVLLVVAWQYPEQLEGFMQSVPYEMPAGRW